MSLIHTFKKLPGAFGLVQKKPAAVVIAWLHCTPTLYGEPLKKKKKLDPQIIRQRDERRKKKLEKQIRRLEKNSRQLKPVEEIEVPLKLLDEKEIRTRVNKPLTVDEEERRYQLQKEWCKYKHQEKMNDFQTIDRLLHAQEKALQELRLESEELYQEAIQPDMYLLPIKIKGPVATPAIENYDSPDGEYMLKVKNWD